MGLFDNLRAAVNQVNHAAQTVQAVKAAIPKTNPSETYSFEKVPADLAELAKVKESISYSTFSPYKTVAVVMLVLLRYESDPEGCFAMLDELKGPEDVSTYEKSFIKERLSGKAYKVRSFFKGATTANNYTPTEPLTVTVTSNPYSFENENWAMMYVQSSGADAPRGIKLRKKPSTGEWFLNDIQCLSDIRIPAAEDKWA